ncbi:hypothetical protein [Deinococcus fonticola]|uniref:hypothetical protein n=1 Tax=Deinococcus fonticola TaxID=2528713 RepID=UPI0014318114|nr:hypothetical protein [Deinococcus fonticola]
MSGRQVHEVSGKQFYTFELWESGLWNYQKCRLDLKVIALFCEKLEEIYGLVQCRGGSLNAKVFESVTQHQTHLAQVIQDGHFGLGAKWYPTDFISDGD